MVDYFLEYMFFFTLIFRWVILVLGTGLIIYFLKRRRKNDGLRLWIYFSIFLITLIVGWAIYQISWYDFRVLVNF
jgi:hypothetical protein